MARERWQTAPGGKCPGWKKCVLERPSRGTSRGIPGSRQRVLLPSDALAPLGQKTVAFNYASLWVREICVFKHHLLGTSDNLYRNAPNQMFVAKVGEGMEEVSARHDPS